MPKILKNKNIFYILLSVGFFLLINASNIFYYIQADYISGWDGLGHVSFAYAYHTTIFPHLFGALQVWFNGMPFPHFYPPLFYIVTSFLAFVGDQTLYITLFKFFNILMLIATVIGFYFLSLEFLSSKTKALATTFFGILILSTYNRIGDLGVSVESVFNYGFLPQSFSFIFFIFFVVFFNKEQTVKNRLLGIGSLLAIALSNIHVLFITVFYIVTYFAYELCDRNFTVLRKKIIDCCIAALLSLFWFLPMFYYYQFSGARSSNYGGQQFIGVYLMLAVIVSIISMYISHKEKNKKIFILALYVFLISALNYLPITELIISIPLHVKRWIIVPILLTPILSIYLIGKNKILRFLNTVGLVCVCFLYIYSIPQQNTKGYYTTAAADDFQPMIDYLVAHKENTDLINIESNYTDGFSDYWYIHELLGMNGVNTTYAILRESAGMSSTFATIRNSIALDQEGIGTKLNVINQSAKRNYFIDSGIQTGITHFLIKSTFAKKALSKNKDVVLEKEFKYWSLYRARKPVEKISGTNLKTVLTYTDFNLKKNTENQFDMTRLSEELVYHNMLDLIFYQSADRDLSHQVNYKASSAIFIPQYSYSDLDAAYDNIVKMSHDRPVYLLKDYENDLFKKLYKNLENAPNIYFINPKNYTINSDSYHENYKYIFRLINARAGDFRSNEFRYRRQSYFPNIHAEHKRYVATPFYILESKTEKNDDTFDVIRFATALSLVSMLGAIGYFTYISRKRS